MLFHKCWSQKQVFFGSRNITRKKWKYLTWTRRTTKAITQYNTSTNKIKKKIINNNWKIIASGPLLQAVFPSAPVISFKRALTTGDKLVHSYRPGDKKGHLAWSQTTRVFFLSAVVDVITVTSCNKLRTLSMHIQPIR